MAASQAAHGGSIPLTRFLFRMRQKKCCAHSLGQRAFISNWPAWCCQYASVQRAQLPRLAILLALTFGHSQLVFAKKPKVPNLDAPFVTQSVPSNMLTG